METLYLVTYVRHNKKTGGVAYKTEIATPDLAEARNKYHALFAEYAKKESDFDFVSVILTDSFGNRLDGEYWEENVEAEV